MITRPLEAHRVAVLGLRLDSYFLISLVILADFVLANLPA